MSKPATKPELASVPDAEPAPGTLRVWMDDKHWVDMSREMDGEDFMLLHRLQEVDVSDEDALMAMYIPILTLIEKRTVGHNLDNKPILRGRSLPELRLLWRKWNEAVATAALDPTPAAV